MPSGGFGQGLGARAAGQLLKKGALEVKSPPSFPILHHPSLDWGTTCIKSLGCHGCELREHLLCPAARCSLFYSPDMFCFWSYVSHQTVSFMPSTYLMAHLVARLGSSALGRVYGQHSSSVQAGNVKPDRIWMNLLNPKMFPMFQDVPRCSKYLSSTICDSVFFRNWSLGDCLHDGTGNVRGTGLHQRRWWASRGIGGRKSCLARCHSRTFWTPSSTRRMVSRGKHRETMQRLVFCWKGSRL